MYTFTVMFSFNFLFIKYWYLPGMPFKHAIMPGRVKGLSGSTIGGHNLGINKYSDPAKRNAVIEAFKYLASKDMQKKYIALDNYFSPIPSLYDDEEVCNEVDCQYYKSIQLAARPVSESEDYLKYSEKYKNYIYEYLFGNKTVIEVLRKVEDISKIYKYSISTEDSIMGLVNFISIVSLSSIMLLSLVFIFIKKFNVFFQFLPRDLWIIYIFGLILLMSCFFTEIGTITKSKCHLRALLLSIGFTINLAPIIYRLIVSFPEKDNKISEWVLNHKYLFISFFWIGDMILNLMLLISPYSVENRTKVFMEAKNFETCQLNSVFGNFIIYLMIGYKIIMILCIIFLIFLEWNYKPLHYDIRFLTYTIYINVVLLLIYVIIIIFINFKNYIHFYAIRQSLCIFYSLSSFILFYFIRIIWVILGRNDSLSKSKVLNKYLERLDNNDNSGTGRSADFRSNYPSTRNVGKTSMISSVSRKIIDYHYRTGVDTETIGQVSGGFSSILRSSNNN